ncbi:unnamed protein product [Meloidogyne enterolobii]|uniref:Uncharacterized protein n=2 Tax=Meloidogyne enterolobii TaxID=390850 RepID=A0ACB0XVZ6_MELEN
MEEFPVIAHRPSSFLRFSASFFKFPVFFRRSRGSSTRSSPISRFFFKLRTTNLFSRLISPRETPSTSSISPMVESVTSLPTVLNGSLLTASDSTRHKPLLRPEEIKLVAQTLKKLRRGLFYKINFLKIFCRALQTVDFGNEIVIRLLNDKRSLYKSLLARCAPQAHEIEVFDVQSLARFCPRAVQVGNGVTRFFERIVIALEDEYQNIIELEEKLAEMCRANGQMHYRMKVWFQAENWLCVKHSVVDTVLMANSNLKRGKQIFARSAGDLYGLTKQKNWLNCVETLEHCKNEKHSIGVVWMKLMQAVIAWMKQGFLEAAMSSKEEHDEEL